MKLDGTIKDLQNEKTRLEGQLKSVTVALGLLTKLNSKSVKDSVEPAAKPSLSIPTPQAAAVPKPVVSAQPFKPAGTQSA